MPTGAEPYARYFAFDVLRDVEQLSPNPLLETKPEFLRRAKAAWNAAEAALAGQGISHSAPRQLALHCEWLVRSHVLGETAATILKHRKADTSTVYKAVRQLALLIELPTRT
jgi:hypothetical protein